MLETFAQTKEGLSPYAAELHIAGAVVTVIVLALVVRNLLLKALRLFFSAAAARTELVEERKRIETVARVAARSTSLLIWLVAGMVILNQLGISIAPILGAAGVVGIAVGFGAQSLVRDLFTGIVLLVENQVRVGDSVELAGKSGVVEELSLRRIKLRDADGSVHFVSNGLISTVTNRSADYAYAVMDVAIDYRENIDRVYELMHQVAAALQADPVYRSRILGKLEIAGLDQWAESGVVIRCRMKTQPLEQAGVRREFIRRLKILFEKQGIAIPAREYRLVGTGAAGAQAAVPAAELAVEPRP